MTQTPEHDPTARVRRIGWALIIVFAAVIIALFLVLLFVDPGDDDDEAEEGADAGWLLPDGDEKSGLEAVGVHVG